MESIGIELNDSFYRLASLKKRGKKIEISSLIEAPNVNPLDISLKKKRIVSGIGPSDLLIKRSFLKLKKKSELKKALPFQMKTLTSLPLGEAIILPQILQQENEGFHLLYFVTTKQNVQEHLEKLSSFRLDPDIVTATPMALSRFAQFLFPTTPSLVLLHLEQEHAFCIFIEQNLPVAAFVLTKEEKKSKKKEEWQDPFELDPCWKQKVAYCCASFLKSRTDKLPLLVTGEFSSSPFLETTLLPSLSNHISHLLYSEKEKEMKFALSIGLALEGLSSSSLSFRSTDLLSTKQLHFLGQRFSLCLCLSLLLLFCCSKAAFRLLEKQKKTFEKNWQTFCLQEGQKENDLSLLEKMIRKEGQDFPFFLKMPKATSLLFWLKNHPIFGKTENGQALFELLNFHYELLDMPRLADPQKPYVAKIEIEFFTLNAAEARKLHQSLLEEKELLDTKELFWSPLSENCYKVSFFLKPLSLKEVYSHENL